MDIDPSIIAYFFGAYIMGWGSGFLILVIKQFLERV